MIKKIFFSSFLLITLSCKSTKVITEGAVNDKLNAKSIIKSHYANTLDFKTLSGKMSIDYKDNYASQGFNVSLRMEKDKAIWISAPLGVVKSYITPTRVSFYNRLDGSYFDGDFSYLSQLLGTDLDFDKVQNLLLGQAILDLRKDKYNASISNESYLLKPKNAQDLFKILFQIEPKNFKLGSQQISQPEIGRFLDITYRNYQEIDQKIIPNEIAISANMENNQSNIAIEYKNMVFNRSLKFPYDIPKGFKEIRLK